jgi:hypothetical protein
LFSFTPPELRALRALKSPEGIQAFLDRIPYHIGTTAWSPRVVLREQSAHCLEGALFAAAALRVLGHRPLILDLEADDDSDHVIAVYRQDGAWGSIASSNYATCGGRSPVYRTVRELALSYFEGYFNLRRKKSLRRFSQPVNLARFDGRGWMTSEKSVWFIVDHLFDIPHTELLTPKMKKSLTPVDRRLFVAGLHGRR